MILLGAAARPITTCVKHLRQQDRRRKVQGPSSVRVSDTRTRDEVSTSCDWMVCQSDFFSAFFWKKRCRSVPSNFLKSPRRRGGARASASGSCRSCRAASPGQHWLFDSLGSSVSVEKLATCVSWVAMLGKVLEARLEARRRGWPKALEPDVAAKQQAVERLWSP